MVRCRVWLIVALTAAAASAHARDVTDALGREVAVPEEPARVVALTSVDLDSALALGVEPVATLNGRGQSSPPRYLRDRLGDIAVVGDFPRPSLGRLVELQPDLILAGGLPDRQLIEQLGRIAPTVVTYGLGETWFDAVDRAGAALGRAAAADDVVEQYRERVRSVAGSLCAEPDTTISIVRWHGRGPAYMYRDAFASAIARDVGLRRPPGQRDPGMRHSSTLSLEALERIDADWLFVGTLQPEGEADQALAAMRQRPAFQQLDAVRRDRVVRVDGSLWTSLAGPIGAGMVLDDIERALGGC